MSHDVVDYAVPHSATAEKFSGQGVTALLDAGVSLCVSNFQPPAAGVRHVVTGPQHFERMGFGGAKETKCAAV